MSAVDTGTSDVAGITTSDITTSELVTIEVANAEVDGYRENTYITEYHYTLNFVQIILAVYKLKSYTHIKLFKFTYLALFQQVYPDHSFVRNRLSTTYVNELFPLFVEEFKEKGSWRVDCFANIV